MPPTSLERAVDRHEGERPYRSFRVWPIAEGQEGWEGVTRMKGVVNWDVQ